MQIHPTITLTEETQNLFFERKNSEHFCKCIIPQNLLLQAVSN